MSHRCSHTHCQVAQANTQAKTWQRVCLPHPEKIELKKLSFPSENKKYATAQPIDRQIIINEWYRTELKKLIQPIIDKWENKLVLQLLTGK